MIKEIVDFHSHMLPEMDDGSSSAEQSLDMIRQSAEQGITGIVLTPHFYAHRDHPEHFLAKREQRMEQLQALLPASAPKLFLGAEVHYFEGMTEMDELPLMKIRGTDCLLVEMPFRQWNSRMITDILEIQHRKNYTVILAHVERYIRAQKPYAMEALLSDGVLFQANAEFFLKRFSRGKALKMLEQGWIHLLGSDSHNTSTRPPNLGSACSLITEKCGEGAIRHIMNRSVRLLTKDYSIGDDVSSREVLT